MNEFYTSFVKKLSLTGCREIVVCAGSQNAPLVAYLNKLQEFELHHHFDERSAAFFALGRASYTNKTVAVLTTSGTAVAECIPAMCEALARELPLLLLSADKTSRFKNTAYPQTCDQFSLTAGCRKRGVELEGNLDGFDPAPLSGPEHWNLRVDDPAFEPGIFKPISYSIEDFLKFPELYIWVGPLYRDDEKQRAQDLLSAHEGPFYAEALSGLQAQWSQKENFLKPHGWLALEPRPPILKLGHAPLDKIWRDLDRKHSLRSVPVFSVSGHDTLPTNPHHLPLDRLSGACAWGALPKSLKTAARARRGIAPEPHSLLGYKPIIEAIHARIPEGSTLYLANSLAIRVWEKWNPQLQKKFHYVANRGLNGIDGQVASFLGMSGGHQEAWLLVGDLTLVYDSNALDFLRRIPHKIRIVLLDNGGGQIFKELKYFKQSFADDKSAALICNPQQRDWSQWAAFWGLDYFASPQDFEESSQHALIHCKV
jgi:2-succinyl-5-enolpyruvyl-6-hydroxy-3-cyclohexene-1-carboxylate synthase